MSDRFEARRARVIDRYSQNGDEVPEVTLMSQRQNELANCTDPFTGEWMDPERLCEYM